MSNNSWKGTSAHVGWMEAGKRIREEWITLGMEISHEWEVSDQNHDYGKVQKGGTQIYN